MYYKLLVLLQFESFKIPSMYLYFIFIYLFIIALWC